MLFIKHYVEFGIIFFRVGSDSLKTYKLFICQYNILKNNYVTYAKIVKTNDIYHEIGYLYCTELQHIIRIDYMELKGDSNVKNKRSNK